MLILKIAFRNVFRQKRRTVLTVLMMCGGFALSSLSIGLSDGTYNDIIDNFTRSRLGHIQIHNRAYAKRASLYDTVDDYETLGSRVKKIAGVEAWMPRLYAAGLGSVGQQTSAIHVVGIDPLLEEQATRFSRKIQKGGMLAKNARAEVLIGKTLAVILHADIGDDMVIISQAADGSLANDLYHIKGIVDSGDPALDRSSVYMTIDAAQELFVLSHRVHEIGVIVEHLSGIDRIKKEVQAVAGETYLVRTWEEFARSFYIAMKVDQQGTWITLVVILLIVGFGVLNTVLMAVLERRREYGLLRAMGTRPWQVMKLVVYEVGIMTIVSLLIGIPLSLFGNYLFSIYGIRLPEAITYGGMEFSRMNAEINARLIYLPAGAVIFSALCVAVIPAVMAAKVDPAKAMRRF